MTDVMRVHTNQERSSDSLEALVLVEIGEHLTAADSLAASYARDYCKSLQGGSRVRPPRGLHPSIAHLVREVALDASSIARRAA